MTLTLGRNTGLAILKDAGIQCSHGTPSTEATAPTVDAASVGADPELGTGISKLPAARRSYFSVLVHPGASAHHYCNTSELAGTPAAKFGPWVPCAAFRPEQPLPGWVPHFSCAWLPPLRGLP
jgi:hypothetical protein